MRIVQIALVVTVVIVGFLGYTKPGHRVLNAIGLPTACKQGCSYEEPAPVREAFSWSVMGHFMQSNLVGL